MDLFIHLYAIVGIAIRLPEIEREGQLALFRNAIAALARMEGFAAGDGVPRRRERVTEGQAPDIREEISQIRSNFVEWRKKDFTLGTPEQRGIIEAAVRLAGESDVSGL